MGKRVPGLMVGLRALVVGLGFWLASGPAAHADCSEDVVRLRGDWGQAQLSVEVADDVHERAQGLMHRESLPRFAGMLFVFESTQPVGFWMRNTLIPLDMIFADEAGVVTHIHPNAVPHDETPISSLGPVRYVLEINGGLAEVLGLNVGSDMQHPAFGADAAWACGT